MKVAFTSSDGRMIDQHFALADAFFVWEVDAEQAVCLRRIGAPPGSDEEDRITARASSLKDCAIVYTMQIGGPAAAKLAARHIQPLKTTIPTPIVEVVSKLQGVLKGKPPPWMRKLQEDSQAMGEQVRIEKS